MYPSRKNLTNNKNHHKKLNNYQLFSNKKHINPFMCKSPTNFLPDIGWPFQDPNTKGLVEFPH